MPARSIRWLALAAPIAAIVAICGSTARADTAQEIDARLERQLAGESAAAAAPFREANAARERGDHARARELYGKVMELAPRFAAAPRRACEEELALDRHDAAIELCRKAMELDGDRVDVVTLAAALASNGATEGEAAEAKALANRAIIMGPGDAYTLGEACYVGLATRDEPLVRRAGAELEKLDAGEGGGALCRAVFALSEGRYDDADRLAARAEHEGVPHDVVAGLRATIRDARPWYEAAASVAWKLAAGWLGAFVVLFGAGLALSRATLGWVARAPAEDPPRGLRASYRVVLWLCCAFYYVSIPLVLGAVVALFAAVVTGFLALGFVPIRLLVIGLVVVVATLAAVIRSFFARGKDVDPGARLERGDHPRLDAVLDEVAERVGTARVDAVFLTPGAELAVFERAGFGNQLRGAAERCLVLGAGALQGLHVGELKAVLAHEHGHLRNEDTAGGGFALAVRRSFTRLVLGLVQGGAAAWYNPAWWFVRAFSRVFFVVSQGASRLQELLADRWAAAAYGAEAFARGLERVVRGSVRFDAHVDATVREVAKKKAPLENLYAYTPEKLDDTTKEAAAAMARKPTAYDSHPAPEQRVAFVKALGLPEPAPVEGDDALAWTLFDGRERLERAMTDVVREQLEARYGIQIAAEAKPKRERREARAAS